MNSKAIVVLSIALLLGLNFVPVSKSHGQQRRQIRIERANQMRNLNRQGTEIRRLIGDVVIKHEDVTMKCDSAYEYMGTNSFVAYGNVQVFQEDKTLYGDTLYFDGNLKRGKVRGDIVKLVETDATLITNFIDFNTQNNSAIFYGGGIITTSDSRFSCDKGEHFSNQKLFIFSGDVAYLSPDMLVNSDSIQYNSDTELITFFGPTRIYSDDNYLYCEYGWHDRHKNKSLFEKNAFVDNGKQQIFGNSIFSDQEVGFAQINQNGCIIDTTQNTILFGNSIKYFEKEEYAEVNDNPLALLITENTDTLFLRADVFIAKSVKDSIHSDSTLYQMLKGIGDATFYRDDMQGKSDSMVYHSVDSTLTMYQYPILWNEENQLTANQISMLFKNETIEKMFLTGSSFVCSQEDSTNFNQISGREMIGFFTNGALTQLDVNGNGQTVYFARENNVVTAVNRSESSRLSIYIKDNQVTSIMFREAPIANLYPINKAEKEDITLKGFAWHSDKRPKSKDDIIPKGLEVAFYIPIQTKANYYREKRKNPAETL